MSLPEVRIPLDLSAVTRLEPGVTHLVAAGQPGRSAEVVEVYVISRWGPDEQDITIFSAVPGYGHDIEVTLR